MKAELHDLQEFQHKFWFCDSTETQSWSWDLKHFWVLPADCGQQKLWNCWNSAEEKWIPTTSDWELLPFISENHHCLPGFWHPGIQISSLLWCLRDNNSWKKENPSVYGVRPCFCIISISRNWQVNRNKTCFEETLWHGEELWHTGLSVSWRIFMLDLTTSHSEQPRWQNLHHPQLKCQSEKCFQIWGLAPPVLCVSFQRSRDEGSPCQSWVNNNCLTTPRTPCGWRG